MSHLSGIIRREGSSSVVAEICSVLYKWKVEPIAFQTQVDIQHEGDRLKAMYLVRSGWVYSYAVLADGQRQILFLYQAGDIAGLSDLGVERASCSIRSLRNCVVLPIPINVLASLASSAPDITTYLLQKSAEMQSTLMRTLTAVGRMEARSRVIWLILMLHDKVPRSECGRPIVEIPFNQSEIGDLLGLSNVSVSKMLCQLSHEGFIERRGSKILLRREADMQAMINFAPTGFRRVLSNI